MKHIITLSILLVCLVGYSQPRTVPMCDLTTGETIYVEWAADVLDCCYEWSGSDWVKRETENGEPDCDNLGNCKECNVPFNKVCNEKLERTVAYDNGISGGSSSNTCGSRPNFVRFSWEFEVIGWSVNGTDYGVGETIGPFTGWTPQLQGWSDFFNEFDPTQQSDSDFGRKPAPYWRFAQITTCNPDVSYGNLVLRRKSDGCIYTIHPNCPTEEKETVYDYWIYDCETEETERKYCELTYVDDVETFVDIPQPDSLSCFVPCGYQFSEIIEDGAVSPCNTVEYYPCDKINETTTVELIFIVTDCPTGRTIEIYELQNYLTSENPDDLTDYEFTELVDCATGESFEPDQVDEELGASCETPIHIVQCPDPICPEPDPELLCDENGIKYIIISQLELCGPSGTFLADDYYDDPKVLTIYEPIGEPKICEDSEVKESICIMDECGNRFSCHTTINSVNGTLIESDTYTNYIDPQCKSEEEREIKKLATASVKGAVKSIKLTVSVINEGIKDNGGTATPIGETCPCPCPKEKECCDFYVNSNRNGISNPNLYSNFEYGTVVGDTWLDFMTAYEFQGGSISQECPDGSCNVSIFSLCDWNFKRPFTYEDENGERQEIITTCSLGCIEICKEPCEDFEEETTTELIERICQEFATDLSISITTFCDPETGEIGETKGELEIPREEKCLLENEEWKLAANDINSTDGATGWVGGHYRTECPLWSDDVCKCGVVNWSAPDALFMFGLSDDLAGSWTGDLIFYVYKRTTATVVRQWLRPYSETGGFLTGWLDMGGASANNKICLERQSGTEFWYIDGVQVATSVGNNNGLYCWSSPYILTTGIWSTGTHAFSEVTYCPESCNLNRGIINASRSSAKFKEYTDQEAIEILKSDGLDKEDIELIMNP